MADISKITPPGSQTTYNLKDATAREQANWNTNNGVKNLLDSQAVTTVKNGVTFTVNADKSITVSGTNSVNDTTNLPITNGYVSNVWAGKKLSGCTNGSNTSYSLACMYSNDGVSFVKIAYQIDGDYTIENYNYIYIIITIYNNYAITGTQTIYPMIRDVGDSTYQPYSLPNTKITPELIELVDSGVKNIFNEPVLTTGSAGEINVTNNGDGTFTLNTSGATTVNSGVRIGWFTGKQGVTYAVSNYSPSCQLRIRYGSDIILDTSGGTNTFVAPSNAKAELIWYIVSGTTLTNYLLKPMICTKAAWDVSQKFVPYRPTYEETVEQVAENENNISTLMTPKKGTITWETGWTPTSESVSIRQYGNVIVGQIYVVFANNLPTTETTIATISGVDKTRLHYRGIGFTAPQLYNLPTDNVNVFISGTTGKITVTAGTNTGKTLRLNFVYCTSDPA